MTEREPNGLPEWASQEREGDLAWIRQNIEVFWPAAQVGYESVGRGALVVDTTVRLAGAGHPFGYLDQPALEQVGDADTQRLVSEYEPAQEFVTTLLKAEEQVSSYRLQVIGGQLREQEARGAEAGQPQKAAEQPALEPPDLETLMRWEAEGGCEAACPHGCWTEPDGTCPHGNPSWLLALGLI